MQPPLSGRRTELGQPMADVAVLGAAGQVLLRLDGDVINAEIVVGYILHLVKRLVYATLVREVHQYVGVNASSSQGHSIVTGGLLSPFVVRPSNHERTVLRQACPEPAEGLRTNGTFNN